MPVAGCARAEEGFDGIEVDETLEDEELRSSRGWAGGERRGGRGGGGAWDGSHPDATVVRAALVALEL